MINGLFETHVNVADLTRAMRFYNQLPDFSLGYLDEDRRIAFYFIGGWGHTMLGLWERPEALHVQHLAFAVDRENFDAALNDLKAKGIELLDFVGQPSDEPTVFGWMPGVGIYFRDPDGHLLEYLARLPGAPRPEAGVLTLGQWRALNGD